MKLRWPLEREGIGSAPEPSDCLGHPSATRRGPLMDCAAEPLPTHRIVRCKKMVVVDTKLWGGLLGGNG